MPKLSDYPEIDFIDVEVADVEQKIFALYTKITGRTLSAGDPVRLFILFVCNLVIMLLNKINETGKRNLLKNAEENDLDQIGLLVGTTRLQADSASTILKITLSAERDVETIIPQGTRVAAADDIYFATVNDVIIPPSGMTAMVTAKCLETGEIGNGFEAGTIKQIVDPVAYVASMVNISKSEGGSDVESDESLRERIFEAPESFSVAGSEGAYEYHAKSVNTAVIDVALDSPEPGTVQITALLTGGIIPEKTVLDDIKNHLSAKTIRPLTDYLIVAKPENVDYEINLKYWVYNDADFVETQTAVYQAINDYKLWQRTKLGRDINPDELKKRLKLIAGVKRSEIYTPIFTPLTKLQVAQDVKTLIAMEGDEEE